MTGVVLEIVESIEQAGGEMRTANTGTARFDGVASSVVIPLRGINWKIDAFLATPIGHPCALWFDSFGSAGVKVRRGALDPVPGLTFFFRVSGI